MSLIDKLSKNSTIKYASVLSKSEVYNKKSDTPTYVPMVNVALSASLDSGFGPGIIQIAGKSKHFKSGFAILLAAAFLEKNPDGIILFLDSEFGIPKEYFKTFGVPLEKVLHVPITNIGELKHESMNQLENIDRGDKVFIIVDSVGNLASIKEVDDAMTGSDKQDMTRAKQLKSWGRMITPHLTLKDITMVIINHTYADISSTYAKDIVGGGQGLYLSSDTIWIIGRQQDKNQTTKELHGYDFIINVEKSRHVQEQAKIPIRIDFKKGIQKWSGMLDVAMEGGYVGKPKNGWYQKIIDGEFVGKSYREKEIMSAESDEFWNDIIDNSNFKDYIRAKYKIGDAQIKQYDLDEEELIEE